MTHSLNKPSLFAQSPEGVVLLGGRCVCGHVFFPWQTFGCERCGRNGDALKELALRGNGALIASVTVHMHADKRRTVPFVVGTVALDEGPVIRTLLTRAPPDPGTTSVRMVATLVVVPAEDASEKLDLRFSYVHGANS